MNNAIDAAVWEWFEGPIISLIDTQNTLEQGQIIEKDIKCDTITVGLSAYAAPEIPWFGRILTLIASDVTFRAFYTAKCLWNGSHKAFSTKKYRFPVNMRVKFLFWIFHYTGWINKSFLSLGYIKTAPVAPFQRDSMNMKHHEFCQTSQNTHF